ncbi:TorF family putative porin [Hyphococcus flavus]|uniref:TorF family putative porin n=1 Tax=Hyphococcus flavus TaxID=1866326 RepID=A0AAE9ZIC0_9PROT|nr:TorF family putative porin [Hyphococcus flavus]WDI30840.1 TorF family putative porin [Hyphococcus flavus]
MLRSLYGAIALSALAHSAQAQSLELSADVAFESRYVFRGVQLQEASIQPAVTLTYGNFYGGAWLALPIGDDDIPYGDELDIFAGYNTSINEIISFDIGLTYYTYPDAQSGFFDDSANTVEIFSGLSFDIPLSPTAYVYRDFMLDTTTVEGGASYSVPVAEKLSLDLGGSLGYVIPDGPGDYLYGLATADLSYAFSNNGSFYVGARYGGSDIPGGSIFDDTTPPTVTTEPSGFWFGLGFSASF